MSTQHTFAGNSVRARIYTTNRADIRSFDFNTFCVCFLLIVFFIFFFFVFSFVVFVFLWPQSLANSSHSPSRWLSLSHPLCMCACVLLVSHIHKYTSNRIRLLTNKMNSMLLESSASPFLHPANTVRRLRDLLLSLWFLCWKPNT